MPHDDKIKQLEERRAFALAMGGGETAGEAPR